MKTKKKKCKVCPKKFEQRNSLQLACSVKCAMVLVNRQKSAKVKQQKQADRLKREALRSRSWYVKKAQAAFNKFVRFRDEKQPCISCQRHHAGQYHAGHYMTTGARSELRFHPANNHKQCSACNNHLSGNLVLYRKNLIEKVGPEMVVYLEDFNIPQKWTVEELKEIAQHYKEELKRIG